MTDAKVVDASALGALLFAEPEAERELDAELVTLDRKLAAAST